ncbi:MAG: hypothetical protein KGL67_01135 [Patescibacteria group bacterium]|nr:hypothetical protein [Patescibacteria group bacterium]
MIRFIMPIIFVGIAITGFFVFTQPLYQDIAALRVDADSYNQALGNSKSLENERDKLTSKYNTFSQNDLDRLQKLLPDNIDNIRLILEIEKIAAPYGMVLKDIVYTADSQANATPAAATAQGGAALTTTTATDFNTLNMSFSVMGTYNNFLNFTKDLESNLRIVDISSVTFSSATVDIKNNPTGIYKYDFKIKTYWLKN